MIPSGLTSSVINRASLGDGYVRVRDGGLVAAVAHPHVESHSQQLGCERLGGFPFSVRR